MCNTEQLTDNNINSRLTILEVAQDLLFGLSFFPRLPMLWCGVMFNSLDFCFKSPREMSRSFNFC